MGIHVLKESDWTDFVEQNIVPLCTEDKLITRSRNESGMTSAKVFALVGDLGAGKTTFSKTFLHRLGVKQHVQSPTFSIINSYDINFNNFTKVFHIDVYRIDNLKELEVLHVEDIFNNPKHIVVVEWADKIKSLVPKEATWITFEHDTLETRKVVVGD